MFFYEIVSEKSTNFAPKIVNKVKYSNGKSNSDR